MSIVVDRKYYKYTYAVFSQPVLSANGTIGGSSFAVTAVNTDSRTQPYYAFDSNKSDTFTAGWLSKASNNYLEWYNPNPINITKLVIQYQTSSAAHVGYISSWKIAASNDNINYTNILSGTTSNYGVATITISHTGYYKYWRFYPLAWSSEWYDIIDLQITAQERAGVVESNKDNYDFYKDIKIKDIYLGTPNTNCLTYVPRNVNLSLSNGTLTLKAGSKVYVPNGFESDGTTPKFDEFITSNDIIDNDFGNASKEVAFLITKGDSANNFSVCPNYTVVSGTSAPDFSAYGYWGLWYDTSNNIIKVQYGTNEWKTYLGYSLPFCLVSSSDSAVTSIDQIFDWCGYIGSTAFVLPGVKGLIPNGFNADGTYKSIEYTVPSVITRQIAGSLGAKIWCIYSNNTIGFGVYDKTIQTLLDRPSSWTGGYYVYVKDENKRYVNQNTSSSNLIVCGNIIADSSSGKITSLTPATVQPLRTGRRINYIYKGSTLVYGVFITKTFYPSSELQQFTVPYGVTKLHVDCVASKGYTNGSFAGGKGGRVQCILNVTPGQVLYITIGTIPTYSAALIYNASDIRIGGTELSNRVIVAGGGGNASICTRSPSGSGGGAGGGLTGANGINCDRTVAGGGGTQTAGGARGYTTDTGGTTGKGYGNVGSFGLGGQGVGGSQSYGGSAQSGSGGAGWYGGGSGGTYEYFGWWTAGGGGGSSYTNSSLCSNVVHTQGYNNGSGYITISLA